MDLGRRLHRLVLKEPWGLQHVAQVYARARELGVHAVGNRCERRCGGSDFVCPPHRHAHAFKRFQQRHRIGSRFGLIDFIVGTSILEPTTHPSAPLPT